MMNRLFQIESHIIMITIDCRTPACLEYGVQKQKKIKILGSLETLIFNVMLATSEKNTRLTFVIGKINVYSLLGLIKLMSAELRVSD